MKIRNTHFGFSIVELVVAAAIILSLVTVATGAWQLFFKVSKTNTQLTQSSLLTEEATEAVNFLRDLGWTANIAPLSAVSPYYLYWNGTSYSLSASPITVNGIYNVKVTFGTVNRDSNSNIIASGGTPDSRTRLVTVDIINATSSQLYMESALLLHDVFHN